MAVVRVVYIMRKCLMRYLAAIIVAACCLGMVSCGDDDEPVLPYPYNNQDSPSPSPSNPSDMLPGYWEGTGTNGDGNSCGMTLQLKSDGTGYILASTSGVVMLRKFHSYTYSGSTLTLNLENGNVLTLYINSLSATSMSVNFSDERGRLEATYSLRKTEDYSGGNNDEYGETEMEEVPTFIVRWNQGTGKYTSSLENYYKKLSTTGRYTLYRHSNGTGEIGIAYSNNLSTWGGYRVSSYSYLYRDVSTNSSTYYFFN